MKRPTRYQQWTGVPASSGIPTPRTMSKVKEPAKPPILVENMADSVPMAPAGVGRTGDAAHGRPNDRSGCAATATVPLSNGPKATVQDAATKPCEQAINLSLTLRTPQELLLRKAREAFERAYFRQLLACGNDSFARLVETSGLERTHLYRKLKALGIKVGKKER